METDILAILAQEVNLRREILNETKLKFDGSEALERELIENTIILTEAERIYYLATR